MDSARPALSFDAYAAWLQIPGDRRPPNHYDLLGLPTLAPDIERIRAVALERIALVRKYQLGQHAADAIRLLGELSAAFDTLTNPDRKHAYDRGLQALTTNGDRAALETSADPIGVAVTTLPLPLARPLAASAKLSAPPSAAVPSKAPSPLANLASISIQPTGDGAVATRRTHRAKRQPSSGMFVAVGGIVLAAVTVVAYLRPWSSGNLPLSVPPPQVARQAPPIPNKLPPTPNKPVPHVIQPSPSQSIAPAEAPMPPPAKPAAAPKWVPLFLDTSELAGKANLKFINGSWEIGSGAKRQLAQVSRDAIVRARVTKLPGQNVSLSLRGGSGGNYSAWFNGGNWFGVGKAMSGKYYDIKHGRSRRQFTGEFEFKFAVVGDKLTVWADDEVVVQATDRAHTEGTPGFGAANGRGLFRDLEIQVLDTPLSLRTPPQFRLHTAGLTFVALDSSILPARSD